MLSRFSNKGVLFHSPKRSQRMFSALMLASSLAFGGGISLVSEAIACPPPRPVSSNSTGTLIAGQPSSNSRQVAQRVRRDLARRLNIPPGRLQIVSIRQQTWSNGCLDLGTPDEICTAALVEGWQVELTNGQQTWIYHTDQTGQNLRLASQTGSQTQNGSLPAAVSTRILEFASRQAGIPANQLAIAAAEPQVWDGCMGISAGPETVCTMIAINGWRVVVAGGGNAWVYHTNGEATDIRLNETASLPKGQGVVPSIMAENELPPALGEGVVFRAITSGGFAGQTYETILMRDGRLTRAQVMPNGSPSTPEVRRISPQQVQQFERLLQEQRFSNLNHLSYPAQPGAADYFTVTLTGLGTTTRYADINLEATPSALQQVVQAWTQLSNPR